MKIISRLWLLIIMLILLTPLGLILPGYLNSRTPWAEWEMDELRRLVGYAPQGLAALKSVWKAPMTNYGLRGLESRPLIGYVISAIIGILITAGAVFAIGKTLGRKE
jgi:hypothetical protein